jgi:hypothetical protein
MAADTSSAPAAITPGVGAAAADVAALICDPIRATSPAAADTHSGAVDRNDIAHLQLARLATA